MAGVWVGEHEDMFHTTVGLNAAPLGPAPRSLAVQPGRARTQLPVETSWRYCKSLVRGEAMYQQAGLIYFARFSPRRAIWRPLEMNRRHLNTRHTDLQKNLPSTKATWHQKMEATWHQKIDDLFRPDRHIDFLNQALSPFCKKRRQYSM